MVVIKEVLNGLYAKGLYDRTYWLFAFGGGICFLLNLSVLSKREDEGILVRARYQAFACIKAD